MLAFGPSGLSEVSRSAFLCLSSATQSLSNLKAFSSCAASNSWRWYHWTYLDLVSFPLRFRSTQGLRLTLYVIWLTRHRRPHSVSGWTEWLDLTACGSWSWRHSCGGEACFSSRSPSQLFWNFLAYGASFCPCSGFDSISILELQYSTSRLGE